MPRVSVVAKNYAKALYIAARKTNSIAKVTTDLESFKTNFSTSFANELKNPVIAKKDLARIIEEITKKFGLGKLMSDFFGSVVRNRRLNLFPEIYEEFFRLDKQYSNMIEAEVITAVKAQREQLLKIKAILEKKYPDKKIAIREVVKAEILGGLQIKVGSELIDASLKNQLASIRKELLKAAN